MSAISVATISTALTTGTGGMFNTASAMSQAGGVVDETVRNAFRTYNRSGTDTSKTVIAWADPRRKSGVVRNPVGSPGNVIVLTLPGTENNDFDTISGNVLATLAPGEEFYCIDYPQLLMISSDQTSVNKPAGLYVDCEMEKPKAYSPTKPSFGKRAITPKSRQTYSLANVTAYPSSGILMMLSDGLSFVRANPATTRLNNQLQVSSDFLKNPAAPTWRSVFTFPDSNSSYVAWLLELPDGSALVGVTSTVSGVNKTRIFRASDWAAAQATEWKTLPRFEQSVLDGLAATSTGGTIQRNYSGHQFAVGQDGTVVLVEAGPQTRAGSATDGAIRLFMSKDFGITFTTKFNLRDFMTAQSLTAASEQQGVHWHGVAYDDTVSGEKRIDGNYGDNTGAGQVAAGSGYAQVLTSLDDMATCSKLPAAEGWASARNPAGRAQYITTSFNDRVIIKTADATKPLALMAQRKSDKSNEVVMGVQQGNTITKSFGSFLIAGGETVARPAPGTYPAQIVISDDLFNFDGLQFDFIASEATPRIGVAQAYRTANDKVVMISTAVYNGIGGTFVADLVKS